MKSPRFRFHLERKRELGRGPGEATREKFGLNRQGTPPLPPPSRSPHLPSPLPPGPGVQQNNPAIYLTSPIKDEKRPAEQAHLDFNVLFHIKASVGSPMKRHTLETTSKQRRHSSVPSESGGTRGYGGGEKPSRDKNKTKKSPYLLVWFT